MTINTLATTSLATKSPGADGPCHQPTIPKICPPAIMGQKNAVCISQRTRHKLTLNQKPFLRYENGKPIAAHKRNLNFFYLYPVSKGRNFFAPQMGFEVFFKLKNIAICYLNGNCASAKIIPKFRTDNFRIITENFGIAFILRFWGNYGG